MIRVTIACPEAMRQIGNQLAVQFGLHPDDAKTYDAMEWQDAGGNLYAVASAVVTAGWLEKASKAAAGIATIWTGAGKLPAAKLGIITVIVGMDGLAALEAMGLVREARPDDFAPK
jgi:hypothetical protein